MGVAHLIRAFQVNGHHSAQIDPLHLYTKESFPFRPVNCRTPEHIIDGQAEELSPSFHGFDNVKDMDRQLNFRGVHSGGNRGYLEELALMPGKVTLRMILGAFVFTFDNIIQAALFPYLQSHAVGCCTFVPFSV